ncbi:HAD family hydrolase [Myroides odoratus]|uniref:HAD-IA family hydrolase n=1 Tax=Myroides odoratus TaxID=256 RepID=A0A9Q6ZEW8_MYROD|nr:HAD-IA family hydrolase [Myroides odoratus]EHQ42789.1 HAD-superfamily hydrolase, subfamily IA, variant 1 [Myroides odoratus DSM 2801]EKB07366.1 HAD hydrolase, family IA [Myroides odoratus CIP 103059]QQU00145.1 HAD-IA family hydrolase [Myroides odoratus]WQD57634.1 HAD-IA family hydrolase [Myroides odoratus]STZ30053.1 Pyrimidine 5'-nucleotidase YjjG [Myroides odoratus]
MNIDSQGYKHYSFDLWLTLFRSHLEFKTSRARLLKDFFSIENTLDEVSSAFRYYDVLGNHINETTGGNMDTFELYLLILGRFNIRPNYQSLEQFYLESEKLFFNYPPCLLTHFSAADFSALKEKNCTLNVLSNTGFIKGRTIKKYLDQMDLLQYFDFLIFSDEVNLSKPNPEIFQLVRKAVHPQIKDQEILHIGDNLLSDYQGALNAGFSAYLIKNDQ